jgi:zinc transport system substrate-binding protein
MRSSRSIISVLLAVPLLIGCGPSSDSGAREGTARDGASAGSATRDARSMAASNSYLAAAIRDLVGDEAALMVLAEPGMCPGHFDLRPSQMRQMRSCGLLVRFDFQGALDSRLGETDNRPRVVPVRVHGGMCEPESYGSVCRQVADAVVENGLLSRETADQRLSAISRRMGQLADWMVSEVQAAGLRDATALSSGHQAAFCRALGLNVVATFTGADAATPGQIEEALKAGKQSGVRFVIANLPEGRQMADALADRFRAKTVTFGNFPQRQSGSAFDELVRGNVNALLETAKR